MRSSGRYGVLMDIMMKLLMEGWDGVWLYTGVKYIGYRLAEFEWCGEMSLCC